MSSTISFTLLGTGTSQGIPVIGCDCDTCLSENPKDKRLRVSVLVETKEAALVIDCGPDFRQQMLREQVRQIDALVFTHEHNDHVAGLDDVRPFNFRTGKNMPLFATKRVLRQLEGRFAYAFEKNPYPGVPRLEPHVIDPEMTFNVKDITIVPVEIMHGRLPILGFRIGDFAYLTDMKSISDQEFEKLVGTKVLVVDALHQREHHSHMNLEEAIQFSERVGAEKTYLTHISHIMGPQAEVSKKLPKPVAFGYDGLKVVLPY